MLWRIGSSELVQAIVNSSRAFKVLMTCQPEPHLIKTFRELEMEANFASDVYPHLKQELEVILDGLDGLGLGWFLIRPASSAPGGTCGRSAFANAKPTPRSCCLNTYPQYPNIMRCFKDVLGILLYSTWSQCHRILQLHGRLDRGHRKFATGTHLSGRHSSWCT